MILYGVQMRSRKKANFVFVIIVKSNYYVLIFYQAPKEDVKLKIDNFARYRLLSDNLCYG